MSSEQIFCRIEYCIENGFSIIRSNIACIQDSDPNPYHSLALSLRHFIFIKPELKKELTKMSERLKLFSKYLNNGGIYPCNIFNTLIFESPEQVLNTIESVEPNVSLRDRVLCNCFAQIEVECDCLAMPLLNHLVYIISSFGRPFLLAQQIMLALIERGCDVNKIDADIGSVLHSIICCIDNDIQMNVSPVNANSRTDASISCFH